ncbi:hypothetical protein LSUE1_G004720 [Lachnellula suecica]|uniref:NACHT domain-containing protein n=1 Tax=Lachnellula suecica TaxID=602035 RepID=A0A8T9CCD0_9HELO|nr:hypothetical protein LSUE1_G004720 [Lachnellula suecica]
MDPLTALSLAGTVVQFVDFGSKVISRGAELYKSTNGQLAAHRELELMTTDLSNVIIRIQDTYQKGRSEPSILGTDRSTLDPKTACALQRISEEAVSVAQKILDKLDALKVCVRLWLTEKEKGELERLQKRLDKLKDAIDREILVTVLENTNSNTLELTKMFTQLDNQTQIILRALVQSERRTTFEIRSSTAHLMSRHEELANGVYRQNRDVITKDWTFENGDFTNVRSEASHQPATIKAQVEMFTVPSPEESQLRRSVQEAIIESLYYPGMSNRYESLREAHANTFEWVFSTSSHGNGQWYNLASWLKTGKGIYWISGKPGSGKSTLMKSLFDDQRTYTYLNKWADTVDSGNEPLMMATFFFWSGGTPEQRSQIGMLRSLLFQILEQQPDLVPVVFPDIWSSQYIENLSNTGRLVKFTQLWTYRRLIGAFKDIFSQTTINIKLCILIDGLDEFDGDHETLADLFSEIGSMLCHSDSGIKICLASRPWIVYRETFEHGPSLQLQDHNSEDIKHYIIDRFEGNTAFQRLSRKDAKTATDLAREIVNKADGVFIWVYIVVRDLLNAVRNRDSIPDLWKRLSSLPRDIEPLYAHMRSRIEPIYFPWNSKLFQLVRARFELGSIPAAKLVTGDGLTTGYTVAKDDSREGCLSISEIYFALDDDLDQGMVAQMTQSQLQSKSEEFEFYIAARCACLLEVRNIGGHTKVTPNSLVHFIHRTARDFVEEQTRWNEILKFTLETAFNPYWYLMKSQGFALQRLSSEKEQFLDYPEDDQILDGITRILVFASYADAHTLSHIEQSRILDAAAEIIEKHTISLEDWPEPLNNPKIPPELATSFILAALNLNISGYITRKLRKARRRDPAEAAFSASYFLSMMDESNLISIDGLPHMSHNMAKTLIKSGADVNYKRPKVHGINLVRAPDTTTWEGFLERNLPERGMKSNSTWDDFDETFEGRNTNPDLVPLMSLFLASGADPTIIVRGESHGRLTLLHYLKKFIPPHHQNLLRTQIEEALQSSKPSLPHGESFRHDSIGNKTPKPFKALSNNVRSRQYISRLSKDSRLRNIMGKTAPVPETG